MTVREFFCKKTKVHELCVIRESGWVAATAWIDSEDLFTIHPSIANKEVLKDEWGNIEITTEHGDRIKVPCHYIDC